MSWDVMIMNARGTPARVTQMSADWRPIPMGSAEEVRQKIRQTLPEVDLTDPERGHFSGDGYSISFGLPILGEVDVITLHIRGGGDALETIVQLCKVNDWVALDTSSVEFIDLTIPSDKSWQEFQKYRDQALKKHSS